jgi:hypothetical protein
MKHLPKKSNIVFPIVGIIAGFVCNSYAATTVIVDMAAPMGAAPAPNIVVSTGTVRAMGAALPPNIPAQATPTVPESGVVRRPDGSPDTRNRRSPSNRRRATLPAQSQDGDSTKDSIEPVEIEYTDTAAFTFTAEAGYATSHIWRGIDLVEFTSFNHNSNALPSAEPGVSFFGVNATYKGFGFGAKFIESIDDNLNPYFAPLLTDLDSYQELVLSVNYTRMLIGDNILQGTVGFDFYYYPNDEFWGVEHQGMIYARFSSPQHKWAQPFIDFFYNVATDSSGSGLASKAILPPQGFTSFRGALGSDLVEGGGAEFGVSGGDQIFANDRIAVTLTYSLSGFYKTGYAFEDDGFSHVTLTVGTPISFGSNFTITPSVTYVQELSDISPQAGASVKDTNPAAYNEPGFVGAIKATWTF